MRKNSPLHSYLIIIILLIVFCLAAVVFAWVVIQFPKRVASDFGSPAPGLGVVDRYRFGIEFYTNYADYKDAKDLTGQPRLFQIEPGESIASIGARLEEEGLIRETSAFRSYLIYSGLDTQIQAGKFLIDPKQNIIEIVNFLRDATSSVVNFGILPGWRLEEIAALLPTSGLNIDPQEFISRAKNPVGISLPQDMNELSSLEGFLYPDIYEVGRETSTEKLLMIFTQNFDEKVNGVMREGFLQQGLTLYQAVTLASIVEREAMIEEEQPMIASVFLNRLQVGMNLESDPTVQYSAGYNPVQDTWWTNPLSADDLAINSPYNTYLYPGLPPTPICNPGISALEAVAFPATTDYYYFQAACDGSGRHNFARSFEEHLQNSCQ
jgi:UPF0755 protein